VPHVGPDRVQGEIELTRDLGRRQIGRQIAQDARLAFGQGPAQQVRGVPSPLRCPSGQQVEDLRDQRRVRGATPPVPLQQPGGWVEEERDEQALGLGEIERALQRGLGLIGVAERIAGDRFQEKGLDRPDPRTHR